MNPMISIVVSGVRPELWLDLCNSVGESKTSFEAIFVGPNPPDYQLPGNVHFIRSDTKPVQCFEIGTRLALGKYLMMMADDVFFEGTNPLDSLYKEFLAYNTEKLMLSCRLKQILPQGVRVYSEGDHLPAGDNSFGEVILPTGVFMDKTYYGYLGGLDRNFIAVYWDLDLCFRVVEDGGITRLSTVWIAEQCFRCNLDPTISMWHSYGNIDKGITLKQFWPMFGIHNNFKRITLVEPFADEDILTRSQGPKGKWV